MPRVQVSLTALARAEGGALPRLSDTEPGAGATSQPRLQASCSASTQGRLTLVAACRVAELKSEGPVPRVRSGQASEPRPLAFPQQDGAAGGPGGGPVHARHSPPHSEASPRLPSLLGGVVPGGAPRAGGQTTRLTVVWQLASRPWAQGMCTGVGVLPRQCPGPGEAAGRVVTDPCPHTALTTRRSPSTPCAAGSRCP